MRVADYIAKRVAEYGVKHIFMIVGGGAMHLNDAFGRQTDISYICNHHEQATAIAAEGYARVKNSLAVAVVTSGPGGTNTITGVLGQWLDSVPVLYISGQVKYETCVSSIFGSRLRQLGDQEFNISEFVKPITKYSKLVHDAKDIRKEIDKAIYFATSGRFGPVWLDIPLNIQGAQIDEKELEGWSPYKSEYLEFNESDIEEAVKLIRNAYRPIIIAGHGIRLSDGSGDFQAFIRNARIPVVTTFNGYDLIEDEHPQYIGRIGTLGGRAGNFALQNADVVLSIGSRNNIRQVSYNWENFTRAGKLILVDIDKDELSKKTLNPYLCIHSDAKHFLSSINRLIAEIRLPGFDKWNTWCQERKKKYPTVLQQWRDLQDAVHPYHFVNYLTKISDKSTTFVAGNGTACVSLFQAGIVKKGQRFFWNSGCATMGYDLPAAIGAAFAKKSKDDVICLAGDGSIMMNIQELQTIDHYNLPIKLFILNNQGYQSIKQTQKNFFNNIIVGCTPETGVSFPNFRGISKAHNLPYQSINNHNQMENKINQVLAHQGPIVCEVFMDIEYEFIPKLSSEKKDDGRIISKSLEDLSPLLNREELRSNMIIDLKEDS